MAYLGVVHSAKLRNRQIANGRDSAPTEATSETPTEATTEATTETPTEATSEESATHSPIKLIEKTTTSRAENQDFM